MDGASYEDIMKVEVKLEDKDQELPDFIVYDPDTHNIVLNDPTADFDASAWINKPILVKVVGMCAGTTLGNDDYCDLDAEKGPTVNFKFTICAAPCC